MILGLRASRLGPLAGGICWIEVAGRVAQLDWDFGNPLSSAYRFRVSRIRLRTITVVRWDRQSVRVRETPP